MPRPVTSYLAFIFALICNTPRRRRCLPRGEPGRLPTLRAIHRELAPIAVGRLPEGVGHVDHLTPLAKAERHIRGRVRTR